MVKLSFDTRNKETDLIFKNTLTVIGLPCQRTDWLVKLLPKTSYEEQSELIMTTNSMSLKLC